MIGDIEEEIIRILKLINDAQFGWKFNDIKSYAGDFSDENMKSLFVKTPVAFVSFFGDYEAPKNQADGTLRCFSTFRVAIINGNARGEKQVRNPNAPKEIGLYKMINDVRAVLSHYGLDVPCERLRPTGLQITSTFPSASGKQIQLANLEFQTSYESDLSASMPVDLESWDAKIILKERQ